MYLLGEVTVGTPGKTVLVDFSLLQSNTWLLDGRKFGREEFFNPESSTTYVNQSKPFTEYDGVSVIRGWWSEEHFEVSGLTVKDAPFGLIYKCKVTEMGPFEAIGIGGYINGSSFLATLAPLLDRKMFSLWTEP
ncbi:Pcl [Aphelenchoides avenae]|nr:Pcl [Aphelenchus avenae]